MARQDLRRRLAAIVFTDIVGFSKIMNRDESQALEILEIQRRLSTPIIADHDGAILKEMGDGLLIEFASSVNAVQAAVAMQAAIRESSASGNPAFEVRIGIHMGDIVASGRDILGDGVNIASRVEPLADPGGVCLTQPVYDSIKSIVEIKVTRSDDVELKNIEEKYTVYMIQPAERTQASPSVEESPQGIARIDIESIRDETNLKSSIASLWPFHVFMLLIGLLFVETGVWFWAGFMILTVGILTFVLYQRTMRVSFADIRNVGVLLDFLIVRMGYGLMEQNSRCLTYLHAPAEWKTRRVMSWVRTADTLTVEFDGNTVRMKGPNIHIRKVLGEIRKFGRVSSRTAR